MSLTPRALCLRVAEPFKLSLSRPGFDGAAVTCGVAVWRMGDDRVSVYDVPFALLDPMNDACVPRISKPATPPAPRLSWRLPSPITCAAVDGAGSRAVFGCASGSLSVWNLLSGFVTSVLEGLPSAAAAVAFSGTRWIAAGNGGTHRCAAWLRVAVGLGCLCVCSWWPRSTRRLQRWRGRSA